MRLQLSSKLFDLLTTDPAHVRETPGRHWAVGWRGQCRRQLQVHPEEFVGSEARHMEFVVDLRAEHRSWPETEGPDVIDSTGVFESPASRGGMIARVGEARP